jgi:hypothetical protein
MHDDAVARTYGFRGGLVPGVDVWAYMTRPCVDRWGIGFLTGGAMEARFVTPVYDGERVGVTLDDDGTLTVIGGDRTVRATGRAALAAAPPVVAIEATEFPDPVPPASADLLTPGTVLGTLRFHYRREQAAAYLGDIRETSEVYAGGEICHPGFLARQANYVLSSTVRLGPWIHVGTRCNHRGLVHDGDDVEVRGRVSASTERKGHRFVDLDVEITANGTPVWSAAHTAIWQPRTSDG